MHRVHVYPDKYLMSTGDIAGDYFYVYDCSNRTMVPASVVPIASGTVFRDDGVVKIGRPLGFSFPSSFIVSSEPDSSYRVVFRKISPINEVPFLIDDMVNQWYMLEVSDGIFPITPLVRVADI